MPQLQTTRDSAKRTVANLITTHYNTLAEIRAGKRFFKRGEDITEALYHRIEFEIQQCVMVSEAIDRMKAGDVQRAADLCSRIQESILNVQ